jgi:predicted phage terminase large subunit-like protein
VVTVEPDAATFPERKPIELVLRERARGTRTHDAQQRQNPSDDATAMFPSRRWRFYSSLDEVLHRLNDKGERERIEWDDLIQSWDCAFKGTEDSDFVVGQVWGRIGANRYLLDQFREQVGVKGTIAAISEMSRKWPRAHRKLVEDKANGPAVIELLEQKVPGLIAVNPEGGKIVRARAVEPFHEARNLWLPDPQSAPWVVEFMSRAEAFPNVPHDDEVDAMTQANIYFTADLEPRLTVR